MGTDGDQSAASAHVLVQLFLQLDEAVVRAGSERYSAENGADHVRTDGRCGRLHGHCDRRRGRREGVYLWVVCWLDGCVRGGWGDGSGSSSGSGLTGASSRSVKIRNARDNPSKQSKS